MLKYVMDGLSYNNSVCKRSPHFTLLSIPEFKPSGAGYSFVRPAPAFKVFEEKRNMQSIVTLVLWSTSAIFFVSKVPVYVSQPLHCLFKPRASWLVAMATFHS